MTNLSGLTSELDCHGHLLRRQEALKASAEFVLGPSDHRNLTFPGDALCLGKHCLHEFSLGAELDVDEAISNLALVAIGTDTSHEGKSIRLGLELDEAVSRLGAVAVEHDVDGIGARVAWHGDDPGLFAECCDDFGLDDVVGNLVRKVLVGY